MSGWTALCLVMLAGAVGQPGISALVLGVWILVDTPRQRCEKLEARIRELEDRLS